MISVLHGIPYLTLRTLCEVNIIIPLYYSQKSRAPLEYSLFLNPVHPYVLLYLEIFWLQSPCFTSVRPL